jgi:hypothetical protein
VIRRPGASPPTSRFVVEWNYVFEAGTPLRIAGRGVVEEVEKVEEIKSTPKGFRNARRIESHMSPLAGMSR